MRRRRIGCAALFLFLGCDPALDSATAGSGYMQETGEQVPADAIAEGPIPAPGFQIDFFWPVDLAVVGDSIYVVDNGNDHIVVLDRDLVPLGVLGREGEGPGEYQQPISVRQSPNGILVSDMGNSRFTEVGRDGTVLRTFSAPSGLLSFGVTSAGSAIVPSRDSEHHFTRIDPDGREALGIWPRPPARDEGFAVQAGFDDPGVAVTAGDTVHVFDEESGDLYKYAPTGELRLKKSIPKAVRDSAMARVAKRIRDLEKQGLRVMGGNYTKGISVMADGRLILLIRTDQTFALLIEPGSYSVSRIRMPVTSAGRSVFESVRAATVVDSVLYLLRDVSIYAYRLRPSP